MYTAKLVTFFELISYYYYEGLTKEDVYSRFINAVDSIDINNMDETYTKLIPALGHSNGEGVVTEINPLAGLVRVKLTEKPEAPKYFSRDEVRVLMTAKQRKAENVAKNGGQPKPEDEEELEEPILEAPEAEEGVTVTASPVNIKDENAPKQHQKKYFKRHKKKT